jgi:hypothetical protein
MRLLRHFSLHLQGVACAIVLVSAQPSMATLNNIIYQEAFGGSSADLLNGTSVDVSNGPSSNWIANSAFLADGSTNGSHSGSALLDIALAPGTKYSVEVDIKVQEVSLNWGGFGFATSSASTYIGAPGADGGDADLFSDSASGGRAWALIRDRTGGTDNADIEFFRGPSAIAGIDVNDAINIVAGNTYSLEILLTTAANGLSYSVELLVDGVSSLLGDGGLGTPKVVADPISTIQSVGLTFNDDMTNGHVFSNFVVSSVPEPSAFLFGGLVCGVLGIQYARKRLAAAVRSQG